MQLLTNQQMLPAAQDRVWHAPFVVLPKHNLCCAMLVLNMSRCFWWCKHNITAQHILDTLQHYVGLMLQATVFAMEVQQC